MKWKEMKGEVEVKVRKYKVVMVKKVSEER
jgi:hypothetical protein